MIDIVKDLKALEQSIYNLPCSVHGHAFMDEYRTLITKYSAPFSPSDLESWGWEKDETGLYKKGNFEVGIDEYSRIAINFSCPTQFDEVLQPIRVEGITQIEMQMLLNLITGGEG